ncbi:MAG: hypothetical protein CMI18_10725 [Opitutaceae bacterium]|nr:hypothetical protein [Opitutaceae bacterium]
MIRLVQPFAHCIAFAIVAAFAISCSKQDESKEPPKVTESVSAQTIEIQDARDRIVFLDRPAIEVVSLLPSITEYMFELDQGHLLVGRTNWCKHPPEAQEVEVVGTLDNPVVETLVQLNPDLIIASSFLRQEQVAHLESLGLTVAVFDHQSWDSVISDLDRLGQLLGNSDDIKTLVSWMERHRKYVNNEIAELRSPKPITTAVLYALENLYSAGEGTFIDEMIQLAGGKNLGADLSSPWPMFSLEELLKKQPEVLLVSTEAGEPSALAEKIRTMSQGDVWSQIKAIKNNRIYLLDGDTLAVPGPRQNIALMQIAAALHPTLFEAPEQLVHVNLHSNR